MKVIKNIIERLLGRKYYIVVVHRCGTDIYEVNGTLFYTKEQVKCYKQMLLGNRTFEYVETLTLRSHINYISVR